MSPFTAPKVTVIQMSHSDSVIARLPSNKPIHHGQPANTLEFVGVGGDDDGACRIGMCAAISKSLLPTLSAILGTAKKPQCRRH